MARDGTKKRLQMSEAAVFAARHGVEREFTEIENLDVAVESKDVTGSTRKGYVVHLFQQHGLLERFIAEYWPAGGKADSPFRAKYERHWREDVARRAGKTQVIPRTTDAALLQKSGMPITPPIEN